MEAVQLQALISIHTSREGGDPLACNTDGVTCIISIHTSREGGDFFI